MSVLVPRHGLSRNTKRLVFDALFTRQGGKCAICGISQDEIVARAQDWAARNPAHAARAMMPVNTKLHIDHCHWTGRIRGLLCQSCNIWLGHVEHYAFREMPETGTTGEELTEENYTNTCDCIGRWMEKHMEALFQYMQYERWLPTKDILFHLQEVS